MFLVDTNIFLEILLKQDKKEDCKRFLDNNNGELCITDFSLHSIGVILFRHDKVNIFHEFIEDILPNIKLISLPLDQYKYVVNAKQNFGLDFDDAYQYRVAISFGLKIATMDKDFKNIKNDDIFFF